MSRAPLPLRDDERLIFALDVPDRAQALEWVDRLGDSVAFYKIGMELLASGEYFQVLDELARRDKRVFVDLKFFDIPATAAAVIKRLSQWPVSYATIHGWHPAMMEACAAANSSDMRLLAVTVLTSMGRPDLAQMGIDREPVDVVVERALAAQAAGIDGVIASGQEAGPIRAATGAGFSIVCPGIRPGLCRWRRCHRGWSPDPPGHRSAGRGAGHPAGNRVGAGCALRFRCAGCRPERHPDPRGMAFLHPSTERLCPNRRKTCRRFHGLHARHQDDQ